MAQGLPASGAPAGIGGSAPAHQSTGTLVRRLWREHLSRPKWRTGLALLCMSVAAMATAGNAWLLQPALDEVFLERDETMLVLVPLAIVGLALIKGVAGYAQEVLMAFVGQRIIADLQKAMFRHLMRADVAYFQGNTTGRLISRFTVDVHYLRGALEKALTGMAKDALTLLCLVLVMFYQDWRLALLASVVLPATVLPILHFGRKMRRVSSRTQEHMGSLTTLLDQTVQGEPRQPDDRRRFPPDLQARAHPLRLAADRRAAGELRRRGRDLFRRQPRAGRHHHARRLLLVHRCAADGLSAAQGAFLVQCRVAEWPRRRTTDLRAARRAALDRRPTRRPPPG